MAVPVSVPCCRSRHTCDGTAVQPEERCCEQRSAEKRCGDIPRAPMFWGPQFSNPFPGDTVYVASSKATASSR